MQKQRQWTVYILSFFSFLFKFKYITIKWICFIYCLSIGILSAQNTTKTSPSGSISGIIIDENGTPTQYAMLVVVSAKDSAAIGGGLTSEDGKFNIKNLPFGVYLLKIDYVGFASQYTPKFTLSSEKPDYRLNKYQLQLNSKTLEGVTVTAQKEMLQNNLDKKVFNVEASITTEGSTAVEVLENVPAVTVDIDNNVSLRGSENVRILIDERPTTLTLDQIPASMIESIEVITNPSARYEPDGTAGIINIVLKKKKTSGFNGLISASGCMSMIKYPEKYQVNFDKYNAAANLNYRYNRINIYLNYNFSTRPRRFYSTMDRLSWYNGDSLQMKQYNASYRSQFSHNLKTGLDWTINSKNFLYVSGSFNHNTGINTADLDVKNSKLNGDIVSKYTQSSIKNDIFLFGSADAQYKRLFNIKGQELSIEGFYMYSKSNSLSEIEQLYTSSENQYYQNSQDHNINQNIRAKVDFVSPVGNGGRVETGYLFSYRMIDQYSGIETGNSKIDLHTDSSLSNNMSYKEMINAAYLIYSNTFWKKLKLQLGLRGELTHTSTELSLLNETDTTASNQYFDLFPTGHLRFDFNEKHGLQLSYSRRITRPSPRQLSPYVNYTDPRNISAGNPLLKPEYVNSLEFGYNMYVKSSNLNLTVFYRQRNNIITRYTELIDDSTTLTSYQNLRKSQNFGFELIYGQKVCKWWRFNLSGSFYRVIIDSEDLIDQNLSKDWAWNAQLNNTFQFKRDFNIQLNLQYHSSMLTTGSMGYGSGGAGQGRRSPYFTMNIGAKKGFFKNTFNINLRISDLLYTRKIKVKTYSEDPNNGFYATSTRIQDSFQIWLTLSYKINNYANKKDKSTLGNENEMLDDD